VAHVPRFRREVTLLSTAHDPEGLIAAAIDDLQEHAPPCAVRLFWSEEQQVRGELDLALGISWSNVDVGNGAISRETRVDRKIHPADDPLVRAEIISASYVDLDNFCRRNVSHQQEKPHACAPREWLRLLECKIGCLLEHDFKW